MVGSFFHGMQQLAIGVDVSKCATLRGNGQVRKTEDAAKEGGVVAFAREGALMGASATGENEAGGEGVDFEVLEVVIVG